jgi:hypothetical protein
VTLHGEVGLLRLGDASFQPADFPSDFARSPPQGVRRQAAIVDGIDESG